MPNLFGSVIIRRWIEIVACGSLRRAAAHVSAPCAEAAKPIIVIINAGTDDHCRLPGRKSETVPAAGEETLIPRFVTR